MKRKTQWLLLVSLAFFANAGMAQVQPQIPKNLPLHPNVLVTPKIPKLMPDLQFVSENVVNVHEDDTRHIFEITLSITYKNAGNGPTNKRFFLDMQTRYGTTGGGYRYMIIGSPAYLQTMQPGEQRTEQWTFAKDITALGRGRHECVIRMDCNNGIAESNESNNNSPLFTVDIP